MPIENYGVWKAKPVRFTYETKEDDPKSPHLSLFFSDDESGEGRAAVNIKSGDHSDSRLVFWLVENFENFEIYRLLELAPGFHPLKDTDEQARGGLALDYIRENLFRRQTGRLLFHDIPGQRNDIIDELIPVLESAKEKKATIYLYGSRFSDGKGIHNVHMNQGSPTRWRGDNGVGQDGGLILDFGDHWTGVFIGFASQAVHTDDDTGHPIPSHDYLTWNDFLNPEIPEKNRTESDINDSPIVISQALVNPHGPDSRPGINPETITFTNRTAQPMDLFGWRVRNKDGNTSVLPPDASLPPRDSQTFDLRNCPLSNQGGTITLLNAQGLKVHGVRYTKAEAKPEGVLIIF